MVESSPNIVGKGEIARYEHFLLYHSVFKRLDMLTRKNQGLFGKGLISIQRSCLSACLLTCLSVWSVCLPAGLSVCLPVCLKMQFRIKSAYF